jgi:hypothetical protein
MTRYRTDTFLTINVILRSVATKNLVGGIGRYLNSENEILRGVCPEHSRGTQDDVRKGGYLLTMNVILSAVRREESL